MIIKPLLIGALESAINSYLSLDQNKNFFLAPLTGKVIAVTVQPFGETVYLCPTAGSIQILDRFHTSPDTHITGSLWALGLMGLSSRPIRSVFSGEVKIEGDIHTGRKFQELFDKLDINLEEKLSHYTGDRVAHRIARVFRSSQNWVKDSVETFRVNLTEFLQEEIRDLPAVPEMDIFYQHIDELRTAFDRLQSRAERLEMILAARRSASNS
ncbi:MAG: ubiquinone biosynthesis accessory factor UbiJ [Methylosarcina sp.]